MTRMLLVDSHDSAAPLEYYLQEQGFWVDVESEARRLTNELLGRYAIVITETILADVDGFALLRRVREHSFVPIMILTDRNSEDDRITGFDLGADDYVAKPCSPREVLARARAMLRRANPSARSGLIEVLQSGQLSMWPAQRRAEWKGETLMLTSAEYCLLEILLRNAGRPVSKAELAAQAIGQRTVLGTRSVDVHMSSIRRKLGGGSNGRALVQAIRFNGYQLMIQGRRE